MFLTRIPGRARAGLAALAVAAVVVPVAGAAGSAKVHSTSFSLSPNAAVLNCLKAPGKTPKANVTVTRGSLNDTLTLKVSGLKPETGFDLFTVQRSPLDAQGNPVAIPNFGMAWYQSDLETNDEGSGTVKIKTILLDQIFGFD